MVATFTVLAGLTLAVAALGKDVAPPKPVGALPNKNQLRWQDMEFYAFVHFGVNTFTDREWGEGTEDEKIFNPTKLDCRQWVKAFKDAGMKGVILTAKHHDGFCLWPSKYTEHCVKNSPWKGGKGDVVEELSEACKEAGLKFGVYLSPWDRHEPSYGDSPRYNEHYMAQLTELLTNYGPIFEIWWDGACGEGPNGKKQVYDWPAFRAVARKLQPNVVIFSDAGPDIRWVGNEDGYADETNWSPFDNDNYPGQSTTHQTQGDENGANWVPSECDVSIRPGWFYHASQDDQVKSLDHLLDIYFGSVGRNGNMLLNVPADREGLIHPNDVARLKEFRRALQAIFKTDLLKGKPTTASDVRDAGFEPENATGGGRRYWATSDGVTSADLTVDLGKPTEIGFVSIREFIPLGQRVEAFAIDADTPAGWKEIAKGTTIGRKRILRFEPVTATKLRLRIVNARACVTIAEFSAYGSWRP